MKMKNQLTSQKADQMFYRVLDELSQRYLPCAHPFFDKLARFPCEKLCSPRLLGELYLRYQAVCHATRVMIYHLPYLDSPDLRIRKLRIISDDDGIANGDAHHYQLSRAFAHIGAAPVIRDEEFGSLYALQKILDPYTAHFLALVQDLYPRSLGPWCVIETFSDNWMRALKESLSACFPSIKEEPYFADCFDQGVEERHAQEALELTGTILARFPESLEETIEGARQIATGLDGFWSSCSICITSAGSSHKLRQVILINFGTLKRGTLSEAVIVKIRLCQDIIRGMLKRKERIRGSIATIMLCFQGTGEFTHRLALEIKPNSIMNNSVE
jgi:hypothetical protein